MADTDSLVTAAIQLARIECKQDPAGCTGPWCAAQGNIRRALEARGITWKLATPTVAPTPEPKVMAPKAEPKHLHLFVNDVCACGELDD